MKKIFQIAIIASIFTGCNDFLDEENKSNVTAETYYTTEEGYQTLVNANYAQLREIYGQDPWLFAAGTDLYSEGRTQEPVGLSQYTQLNASSDGVDFLYQECFKAIQLANNAIYYADLTEETSDLETLRGEMHFMRANAYFLLVQTYGGVSLIQEPIQEVITEFSRATESEVYELIISDLETALSLVSSGSFNGRVNTRAVNHFLAKVHLTRGYESYAASDDFSDAATYAEAAIAGQTLDLSFAEIWAPGNEMNAETIFSIQFGPGSVSANPTGLGSQQQNFFGSYTGGSENAGNAPFKTYSLIATRFAIDLFEQTDERWEGTFMTEVYDRYYDYFDVDDHSDLEVIHFYEPAWFTTTDSINYVAAHPELITYHKYGEYDAVGGDPTLDYNMIICKKFDDPSSPFPTDGTERRVSTRDFIVARLADTYLVSAEAHLATGDRATALARLNEVRSRAGVADAADGDLDIDYILDERGRELFGEYHRWFDLKRTGKLIERASAHHPLVTASNFDGLGGNLKILRPIPQLALDLNRNDDFVQNPAYN